jgi:hypothetical protein
MMDYEKYRDEFDAFVDETEIIKNKVGEIQIGENFSRYPSIILFDLDETAYYEQLKEYVEQKKADYAEIVYQSFPGPIAYFLYQTEHGYDNEQHRLHLLRSTWESIVYVLYACILGEINFRQFSLSNIRVFETQRIRDNHRGIMTDKLGWKIEFMQRVVEYDQQESNELQNSSYIAPDIFETLRSLNSERNSFSHISALSEVEAKARHKELYPIVIDLLFRLNFLENVSLLRYVRNLGSVTSLRFNRYTGHALQKQNYDKKISSEELTEYSSFLSDEILLLEFDEILFCVSPFIHFRLDGPELRLAYYKQINRDEPKYDFEVIGAENREFTLPRPYIDNFIDTHLGELL